MAIQLPFSSDSGDDYPEAYARIEEVNLHYGEKRGRLTIAYYKTRAAANNGKRPIGSRAFDFQKEAQAELNIPAFDYLFGVAMFAASKTDPLKLGYIWLKTLPEFSGGLDV